MKRLDLALVERGLAPTRAKAQQMIAADEVEILRGTQWIAATMASTKVEPLDVRVRGNASTLRFVSRGGLKLASALNYINLDIKGWRCLDLGQSTGGFTDALLQRGAAAVCGADVGHGQLHPKIQGDGRVVWFEGVHVRDLRSHTSVAKWLSKGVDLCVVDLSFISLLSVVDDLAKVLPVGARLLALVKPQFELGGQHLNKAGVVKDQKLYAELETRVRSGMPGFSVEDYFPSALKGQDGNQEFFVYATRVAVINQVP